MNIWKQKTRRNLILTRQNTSQKREKEEKEKSSKKFEVRTRRLCRQSIILTLVQSLRLCRFLHLHIHLKKEEGGYTILCSIVITTVKKSTIYIKYKRGWSLAHCVIGQNLGITCNDSPERMITSFSHFLVIIKWDFKHKRYSLFWKKYTCKATWVKIQQKGV